MDGSSGCSTSSWKLSLFSCSRSSGCTVMPCCGFNFQFSDEQYSWASFQMLTGHLISSFVKYLFESPVFFKTDLFAFLVSTCKNSLYSIYESFVTCVYPSRLFWLLCVRGQSLSRVQLFSTPWTVACQAPLSMGFSSQESWSVLPFPAPGDLLNLATEHEFLTSCIGRQILYHCTTCEAPLTPLMVLFDEQKFLFVAVIFQLFFKLKYSWFTMCFGIQ